MYSSRIVLNQRQIDVINWKNLQCETTSLVDLLNEEMTVEREQLEMMMKLDILDQENRYTKDGTPLSCEFFNALKSKIYDSLPDNMINIQCAVAINNGLIRAYPTMTGCYRMNEFGELDRFAVSILKLGEPLLIYCETSDGVWCYVRTMQNEGWVLRDTLALEPDIYRWQQYCTDRDQVVVADSRLSLTYSNINGSECHQMILMGTHLPLYDATRSTFLIGFPIRDQRGNFAIMQRVVPRNGAMIPGVMPLSAQNIISQAKKMLGDPYGWGGTNFYRDCTSLICDVYAVFGLQLPRNSNEQMQMFGVEQCPIDRDEKYQFIRHLMPGSVLYIPGHAVIYLGEKENQLQMLHSSYAIGIPDQEQLIIHKIRRVVEGDLSQYRVNGETFFDAIAAVWSPERQKKFLDH